LILDKRTSSGTGYFFYLYGDPPYDNGNPWMGLNLGDAKHGAHAYGSQGLASPSGVGITTGTWHNLAVTVSRKSPGILWYFDGNLLGPLTGPIPTQTGSLLTNSPLRIGAQDADNGGGTNFDGSLDELQIFNRALTGPQVLAIAAAGPSGQCK
jgi:Concanavalin A-like lectin/glucanases superfamily